MHPHSRREQDRQSGYLSEDTIAAITTAVGGAISIVRVSGPNAFSCLDWLTESKLQEPRKLVRCQLKDFQGAPLDDALIVRFENPDSYTGEDVIEFHLHGSVFIASRLMESLAAKNIRQALPGEFSFRAVRNGKLSITQAQAVADLIAASNDGAVALALEKMSGTQNKLLKELAENLRKLATLGEVGIDFSDQDVEELGLPRLKNQLDPILHALEKLQQSYERGSRLQEGIRVAFIGLPNAGKSSFFNCLLGEDRSIVSEIAGTTRDVVREKLTLQGRNSRVTLRLEDTAGLRNTYDRVEKMGIERSEKAAREADLILLLIDPNQEVAASFEQWKNLGVLSERTLGIITKSDLVENTTLDRLIRELSPLGIAQWIKTSAQSGDGIAEAVLAITDRCERWVKRSVGEVLLTRIDQLDAVKSAIEHLQRAKNVMEIDLFASDLRQSLHSLSPMIGNTLPDDILGRIFSEFCIGK